MILTASLVKTSLFLIPTLTIVVPYHDLYVKQISSSECKPAAPTRWNPMTATWIVEAGYESGNVTAFIGHKSYHSVESLKKLESFDYVGIEYSGEFK